MQKWEYRSEPVDLDEFDTMGGEGWELVAVTPPPVAPVLGGTSPDGETWIKGGGSTGASIAFFKRPAQAIEAQELERAGL